MGRISVSFSNVGPSVQKGAAVGGGGDVQVSLTVDWAPLLEALAKGRQTPVKVELDWKPLADRLLTLEAAVAEAGEMMTEQFLEIAEAVRRIEPSFTFSPRVQPSAVQVLPPAERPPSVMVSAVPGLSCVNSTLTLPRGTKLSLLLGLLIAFLQSSLIAWIAYATYEALELSRAFF